MGDLRLNTIPIPQELHAFVGRPHNPGAARPFSELFPLSLGRNDADRCAEHFRKSRRKCSTQGRSIVDGLDCTSWCGKPLSTLVPSLVHEMRRLVRRFAHFLLNTYQSRIRISSAMTFFNAGIPLFRVITKPGSFYLHLPIQTFKLSHGQQISEAAALQMAINGVTQVRVNLVVHHPMEEFCKRQPPHQMRYAVQMMPGFRPRVDDQGYKDFPWNVGEHTFPLRCIRDGNRRIFAGVIVPNFSVDYGYEPPPLSHSHEHYDINKLRSIYGGTDVLHPFDMHIAREQRSQPANAYDFD